MSDSFSSTTVTTSGRVVPSCHFGSAEVISVTPGDTPPEIVIYNGDGPDAVEIGRVAATPGAKIEQVKFCDRGIWLDVLGAPLAIEVEVRFANASLRRSVRTAEGWVCPPVSRPA